MERRIWPRQLGQRLAIVALSSAAIIMSGAGGALASVGYGPPPPAPPTVPGGFFAVVTSQTIGPAGGVIGPVRVGGILTTITVPKGAFPVRVQITVTAPDLGSIGSAGFAGFNAVAGVGVLVQLNGSKYQGTFRKPLTVRMSSSLFTASSSVVVWNGTAFVTETTATVSKGSVTFTFDSDPDFAVLAPTAGAATAIPGATRASTGKPFLGEEILAGLLVLLGMTGLGYARRRASGRCAPSGRRSHDLAGRPEAGSAGRQEA